MLKRTSLFKSVVNLLPNKTGVYLFLNKKEVLYVGKSTNIKKRVVSYFKSNLEKHRMIVSLSKDVKFFLVNSEDDALFLENTLIKKHQPKYNVLLKDSKSFPWLCIKNERFPRVFISRKKHSNSDFYFGPYTSKKTLNSLFSLIRDFYPVRTCNYVLSKKNIADEKYKVCLEYHLKNCLGPCVGFQKEEDYNKNIDSIKSILEGRYSFVLNNLNKQLVFYSSKLLFEKCELIKNQITALKKIKYKSVVVSNKNINIDCFYILSIKNCSYVNFIRVVEGSVVYLNNYKFNNNLYYSDDLVLKSFIETVFFNYKNLNSCIISNIVFSNFLNKKIHIPKRGYKKKILDLSYKNLLNYISNYNSSINILNTLKSDLLLRNIPLKIECFDVSTLMGTNTVSSCVVFKNGKPFKSGYRFFNHDNKIDDYLCIENSIKKRYAKVVKKNLPDLIIIDGGKGHLNTASNILNKLNLSNIDVISIAKKEEIIYLKNLKKIVLNNKSDSLKLIQFLRNEAHRFCLKNHRLKRSKGFIKSELNSINGVGKKTVFKLLKKYKSVNNIKKLNKKDLIGFLGNSKGCIIYKHFKN